MPTDHIQNLQELISNWMDGKASLNVLEAGCGSSSLLVFNKQTTLMGIDISEHQLKRNMILHRKILGDIQRFHFKPGSFDAIVCWDVLEHLPDPRRALQNFFQATNKGGVIILKAPNVFSMKGLLTKLLPYHFHLFIFNYLLRNRARRFKTYLKFSIAPVAMMKFALHHRLEIVYFDTYDLLTSDWFIKNKVSYNVYKIFRKIVETISFGRLGNSEFILVLQKR